MPQWSLTTKAAAVIALLAAYFPIALYLRHGYVLKAPMGMVTGLPRPFTKSTVKDGYACYAPAPALEHLSDSDDNPVLSPFVIYEDDHPLGPAHSRHPDIVKFGHGKFSHWTKTGFVFSSSDGTDPETNGRNYWIVRPPQPKPPAGTVGELNHPFDKLQPDGFAYLSLAPTLERESDSSASPDRSPFVVFENDHALGPAHSQHSDIAKFGHGNFSHWKAGFLFSSSDGTDPETNGRKYWIVRPTSEETDPKK